MKKKILMIYLPILVILIGLGYFWYHWQTNATIQRATPRQAAKVAKVSAVNFVALGDSLTEGIGDDKNEQGYSGRIAQKVKQTYGVSVTMQNFGLAGDRSDQIRKRLNQNGNIQVAVQHANAIILTVGGNDLQQLLLQNMFSKTPEDLTKTVVRGKQAYQGKLTSLFSDIRRLNAQAPIFIFGNYNPLFVHFPKRTDFNQDVMLFNAVNQKVARHDKASYYVGTFDLTYGQYQTKADRERLVEEFDKSDLGNADFKDIQAVLEDKNNVSNQWITTIDNYHPNHIGYNYMATQLFEYLRKEQVTWLTKH